MEYCTITSQSASQPAIKPYTLLKSSESTHRYLSHLELIFRNLQTGLHSLPSRVLYQGPKG